MQDHYTVQSVYTLHADTPVTLNRYEHAQVQTTNATGEVAQGRVLSLTEQDSLMRKETEPEQRHMYVAKRLRSTLDKKCFKILMNTYMYTRGVYSLLIQRLTCHICMVGRRRERGTHW